METDDIMAPEQAESVCDRLASTGQTQAIIQGQPPTSQLDFRKKRGGKHKGAREKASWRNFPFIASMKSWIDSTKLHACQDSCIQGCRFTQSRETWGTTKAHIMICTPNLKTALGILPKEKLGQMHLTALPLLCNTPGSLDKLGFEMVPAAESVTTPLLKI